MDVGRGDGGIGGLGGDVLAVAVVEYVGGVEVLDAEAFGDDADGFADVVLDVSGDRIPDRGERAAGVGEGAVDEVFAQAGGIELGFMLVFDFLCVVEEGEIYGKHVVVLHEAFLMACEEAQEREDESSCAA